MWSGFELIPGTSGWTEKILHNFNDNPLDGNDLAGALIFDAAGNLYGTTQFGGASGFGTVFKLAPRSDGRVAQAFDFAGMSNAVGAPLLRSLQGRESGMHRGFDRATQQIT